MQLSGPQYSFSLVRDERPLTDHGAPGERAVYHPGCYGAFELDPDRHNVEVVNHNQG